jgi:hypothetical protein
MVRPGSPSAVAVRRREIPAMMEAFRAGGGRGGEGRVLQGFEGYEVLCLVCVAQSNPIQPKPTQPSPILSYLSSIVYRGIINVSFINPARRTSRGLSDNLTTTSQRRTLYQDLHTKPG